MNNSPEHGGQAPDNKVIESLRNAMEGTVSVADPLTMIINGATGGEIVKSSGHGGH